MNLMSLRIACVIAAFSSFSHASNLDDALANWRFEGDLVDNAGGSAIKSAEKASPGFEVPGTDKFEAVSGIKAANAGKQAYVFDGSSVLKLFTRKEGKWQFTGDQTFWIRIKWEGAPGGTLLSRNRPLKKLMGVELYMKSGIPSAFISGDGEAIAASVSASSALEAGKWYDISMRFKGGTSLGVDVYDPVTGASVGTATETAGVPATMNTYNNVGMGYFQIGGTNNGSAGNKSGSIFPVGTLVEAVAVWNTCLSNEDIAALSK